MALAYIGAVYAHSRSKGAAKSVMLALAYLADDAGEAELPVSALAALIGTQRNHASTALRELVELGELSIVSIDPNTQVRRYRINLNGGCQIGHTPLCQIGHTPLEGECQIGNTPLCQIGHTPLCQIGNTPLLPIGHTPCAESGTPPEHISPCITASVQPGASTCAGSDTPPTPEISSSAHISINTTEVNDINISLTPEGNTPNIVTTSEPDDPVVMTFLVKSSDPAKREWPLHQSMFNEFQETFGDGLDVLGEFRKARNWCLVKPHKRKTPRGMGAFLLNWLSLAQNSGRQWGGGNRRPAEGGRNGGMIPSVMGRGPSGGNPLDDLPF